jgi:ATP-dependent Clp protease ATP-binding subunit ClpA
MFGAFLRRPMNGYNFTEHVRASLACAREEAARLRHEYVGTEHILLGLLRVPGVATVAIESFGVRADALVETVEGAVKTGAAGQTRGPDLPYTSRAKKVLELAMVEARDLHHDYVGTEHMLLGMLREEKGIAAQVLVNAGMTLDTARERVVEILGGPSPIEETRGLRPVPTVRRRPRGTEPGLSMNPVASGASGHMAASILEALARDSDVGAVFAAQGIDVAKLAAALRSH